MGRPKQRGDLKPLNINIDARLAEKLNEVNANTGLPKTAIVERALIEYFGCHEKELDSFSINKLITTRPIT